MSNKNTRKSHDKPIKIPVDFEEAVRGLLDVKPPPKDKDKSEEKDKKEEKE